MIHPRTRLCAVLLLAAPSPAAAEELTLGMEATARYDDNLFFSEQEEEEISFGFSPRLRVEETQSRLTWSLGYQPTLEKFTTLDFETSWDHRVDLAAEWMVGPRTVLTFEDRFHRAQLQSRIGVGEVDQVGNPIAVDLERSRTKYNDLTLGVVHGLSERLSLALDVNHVLLDRSLTQDSEVLGFTGTLRRVLNERDVVGLGAGFSQQRIEIEDSVSRTRFYNAFGSWQHDFDPTLRLALSAGPALVDASDPDDPSSVTRLRYPVLGKPGQEGLFFVLPDSCPKLPGGAPYLSLDCKLGNERVFFANPTADNPALSLAVPPRESSNRVTFFAAAALTKQWETFAAALRYSRRESSAATLGESTVSDRVTASLNWQPRERWTVHMGASWERESQAAQTESHEIVLMLNEDPIPILDANGVPVPGGQPAMTVAEVAGTSLVLREQDPNEVALDLFALTASVNYRFHRRASVFGRLDWQDQSGSGAGILQASRTAATVGVTFDFEPIHF